MKDYDNYKAASSQIINAINAVSMRVNIFYSKNAFSEYHIHTRNI